MSDSKSHDDKFENSFVQFEERGYDADQDSDDSTDYAPSSHHTHLFVSESKNNVSLGGKPLPHTIPCIKHPWLVSYVLKYLATAYNISGDDEDKIELVKVIKICLKKVFEFQVLHMANNSLLKKEVSKDSFYFFLHLIYNFCIV